MWVGIVTIDGRMRGAPYCGQSKTKVFEATEKDLLSYHKKGMPLEFYKKIQYGKSYKPVGSALPIFEITVSRIKVVDRKELLKKWLTMDML